MEYWTGLKKKAFLPTKLPAIIQKAKQRHPNCAIAIYLAKLKTGLTDEEIADMLVNGKRTTAERQMKNARSGVETDLTLRYVGFANLTRK